MEARTVRESPAAAVIGLVGGALVVIGSLISWFSISINTANLEKALGVDLSNVPQAAALSQTRTVRGTSTGDGKIMLAVGIVILVAALVILLTQVSRILIGIVLLAAGALGAGLGIIDATVQKNDALDQLNSSLGSVLPVAASQIFNLDVGIGLWLCILGAIAAIVAGLMVFVGRARSEPGPAEVPYVDPNAPMVPATATPVMDPVTPIPPYPSASPSAESAPASTEMAEVTETSAEPVPDPQIDETPRDDSSTT